MQIHQLQRKTKQTKSRQVGRGGKRGKTSGRGTKGQKARAGRKLRPEFRDQIKKLPKQRGYRFASIQTKPVVLNLDVLEAAFDSGAEVKPETLLEKKLISRRRGKLPAVKILSDGKITKSLKLSGVSYSAKAKEKLVAVGGQVE